MKAIKILMILFTFYASNARADSNKHLLTPQPPAQNPHPPTSVEDRRRVDFAVAQIRAKYGPSIEIRHPHVIPWSFENFEKNRKPNSTQADASSKIVAPPQSQDGYFSRIELERKSMKAPDLKADEFMVHTYVRDSEHAHWRHLDVILTEDRSRQLSLRGFFDIAMPYDSQLPPGVEC